MAEVKHISIDTSDEEALKIIEEDAAVIVDEVIQETEIDNILEEFGETIISNNLVPLAKAAGSFIAAKVALDKNSTAVRGTFANITL